MRHRWRSLVHMNALAAIADQYQLEYCVTTTPGGLTEEYLYSPTRKYRYAYARWWSGEDSDGDNWILWVMLNPAGHPPDTKRRRTLERVVKRSKELRAAGIVTMNLFALCSPTPAGLRRAKDPIGPFNDQVMQTLAPQASRTVAAWGSRGGSRAGQVRGWLHQPVCFGTTMHGQPRHPLHMYETSSPLTAPVPRAEAMATTARTESGLKTTSSTQPSPGVVTMRERRRGGYRVHRTDCRYAQNVQTPTHTVAAQDIFNYPGWEECGHCRPSIPSGP
jgi:hypothetical protein